MALRTASWLLVPVLIAACGSGSKTPSPSPATPTTSPAAARLTFDPCTAIPPALAKQAGKAKGPAVCKAQSNGHWQWYADKLPTGGNYARGFGLDVVRADGQKGVALIALPAQTKSPVTTAQGVFFSTDMYDHTLQVEKDGWVVSLNVYLYDVEFHYTVVTPADLAPAVQAITARL